MLRYLKSFNIKIIFSKFAPFNILIVSEKKCHSQQFNFELNFFAVEVKPFRERNRFVLLNIHELACNRTILERKMNSGDFKL